MPELCHEPDFEFGGALWFGGVLFGFEFGVLCSGFGMICVGFVSVK